MTLQGRTCSVSRDGRRARALQPIRRSAAHRPADDATRTYLQRVPRCGRARALQQTRRSVANPPAKDAQSPSAPDIQQDNMACSCF
ncbi:hypothetical protein E1J25_00165 [Xanthomonas hortorum pv. taraxaci]|nr:hypothetical protein [Xanthomonas hortorum pv. taraxaci]